MTVSPYYNCMGFFSQILLAVCDAKCKFTSVNVGQYWSTYDSPVLKNSELGKRLVSYLYPSVDTADKQYFKDGELFVLPYYMPCDEIFQLTDYFMRPYPLTRSGKPPIDQVAVNCWFSRARRVKENCFGILVAPWRLFLKPIRADKENIFSYILAGVFLHNELQQTENASYYLQAFLDSEANREFCPGECQYNIKIKNDLKDYLSNKKGLLPWQLYYFRHTGRASGRG